MLALSQKKNRTCFCFVGGVFKTVYAKKPAVCGYQDEQFDVVQNEYEQTLIGKRRVRYDADFGLGCLKLGSQSN